MTTGGERDHKKTESESEKRKIGMKSKKKLKKSWPPRPTIVPSRRAEGNNTGLKFLQDGAPRSSFDVFRSFVVAFVETGSSSIVVAYFEAFPDKQVLL